MVKDRSASVQALSPSSGYVFEQMRMDTMSVFSSLVRALYLLQFGSSGYAIKDILDLPCGNMPILIAGE
jgi:hypothetical protein